MNSYFFVALGLGVVALVWSSARAAAEAASFHGRRSCRDAGVQWLDQSVHLTRLRMRRGPDGRLGIERHYRFEYSRGGDDRQSGRVVLQGRQLQSISGPMPRSEAAT